MGVSVYMGRAGTGKTEACFTRIREILKQNPGESIILLVPDSATYQMERRLAEFMPQKGFTSVRVVGFTRLRHQLFQSIGKRKKEGVSDLGKTLLLRSVMKGREDELTILRGSVARPGFSAILKSLFEECHAFCLSPEDLSKAAKGLSSKTLRDKIADISLLYADYEETLSGLGYKETLEELMEAMEVSPIMENAHVFIDGFHWFTPLQQRVVDTFIKRAKETVITLTVPVEKTNADEKLREWNLFARPMEVYAHLAKNYKTQMKRVVFSEPYRFTNKDLQIMERDFFQSPSKQQKQTLQLTLLEAYNDYKEADAISRKILALVEEGARWKDMMIVLRDHGDFSRILENSFDTYKIPFFSDARHPMVSHPLAECINGIFDFLRRPFQRDILFVLLKTDLLPLTREEADLLENYCLAHGIREKHWLANEDWAYEKNRRESVLPEEEIQEVSDDAESAVNQSRRRLTDIFFPLLAFAKTPHSGADWCKCIFAFMEKLCMAATLSKWHEKEMQTNNFKSASEHVQMYKQMTGLLEEIGRIGKEEVYTAEEMALLFKEGFESGMFSLVPPSLDHVTITTIERGYTGESDYVFLPQLNEGIFPRHMGTEGVLKDKERQELLSTGISMAEGALRQALNENFLFYLATTRGRKNVFLSYVQTDAEGNGLEPSFPVMRLRELGYMGQREKAPLTIAEEEEAQYIWNATQGMSLFSQRMGLLYKGERLSPLWWQFYDWVRTGSYANLLENVVKALGEKNEMPLITADVVQDLLVKNGAFTGSVSRVEAYQRCPFSFYAQYALKLKERSVQKFAQMEIGTFLHENLRIIGERLLADNRQWRDLDEGEQKEICRQVVEELAKELQFGILEGDAFYQNIKARLLATLNRTVMRLSEWSSRSRFDMVAVEKDFGRSGEGWEALRIPVTSSVSLRLIGQIDRIDEYRKEDNLYTLVVDYKSGSTEIKGEDVYYGLKLQLLTYLLAVEKNHQRGELIPSGLIYTYVKNPQESTNFPMTEEKAEQLQSTTGIIKNKGYFSDNRDTLYAMDEAVEGSYSMYVPIRFTKAGIHGSDKQKTKSREDFAVLTSYTERILKKTGEHMLAGHFPISPYMKKGNRPCTYCEYRSVCRFDLALAGNSYRYLESMPEEAALDKMKGGEKVYEVDSRTTGGD